jgi:antitoxin MazE
MKVKVVPIGNSRGIRIPKPLLEQCAIEDAVELRSDGKRIVLTPVKAKPRQGWAEAAARMHEAGDDELLIPDVFEDDIEVEW